MDEGERLYNEALAIESDFRKREGVSSDLSNLGIIARLRGDLEEAERLHKKALAIDREIGKREGVGRSLGNLGFIAREREEYDEAERLYGEALAILREIGDRAGEAASLNNLGNVAHDRMTREDIALGERDRMTRDSLSEAERRYKQTLAIYREIGNRAGTARVLHNLGLLREIAGDYVEAERLYRKYVRISNDIGAPLEDWVVEGGCTDPDADWDQWPIFPPAEVSKDE